MLQWIALGLLVPAAVVLLAAWRRYLAVATQGHRQDRMLACAWAPLLAAGGLLGLLLEREGTLGATGGAAVGMGAMVFAVVTGVVLLSAVSRARRDPWDSDERIPLAWPVAGVMLVLMASAGRVPHTVGLVAFAIGVVLLWSNSLPDRREDGTASDDEYTNGEGVPLAVAFAAAITLGVCTGFSPEPLVGTVTLVAGLVALAVIGLVARFRDGLLAARAGGWFAVMLPCLGLGLLGQGRLVEIIQGGRIPQLPGPPPRLHEMGDLMVPGLVLLAATAVLAGHGRWTSTWRRAASAGLILAGILGTAVLLAGVIG